MSLGQAQALYRLMVNLADEEPMIGSEGQSWSGMIPGHHRLPGCSRDSRIIIIQPMKQEVEKIQEEAEYRDFKRLLEARPKGTSPLLWLVNVHEVPKSYPAFMRRWLDEKKM